MERGGMLLRSGKSMTPSKVSCSTPNSRKRNASQPLESPRSSAKRSRKISSPGSGLLSVDDVSEQTAPRGRRINFDELDGNVGGEARQDAQEKRDAPQGSSRQDAQEQRNAPDAGVQGSSGQDPQEKLNAGLQSRKDGQEQLNAPDAGLQGSSRQDEKLNAPDAALQGSSSKEQVPGCSSEVLKPTPAADIVTVPREVIDIVRQVLRRRLCDSRAAAVLPSLEENKKKLLDLLEHTVVHACNNSSLLLGPRGCGKSVILENALEEMEKRFPGKIRVVRLNGLIHVDDKSAMKEIAKQLCVDQDVEFSKAASFDENLRFLTVVLRDFSVSRKAIVFVLDEFDLFAQRPKQCLLYNLLNVLQSSFSQAAIIGLSCRLDADQLLEKRVRSRFSQRKLLFLPSTADEVTRLLELVLTLPVNSAAPYAQFASCWNAKITANLHHQTTKQLIKEMTDVELSPRYIADIIFRIVCDIKPDKLIGINVKAALCAHKQRPTFDSLLDLSVLELCLLASMKRLEEKDHDTYNFNIVYKEYRQLQSFQSTCDLYSKQAALKAFEHLLEREHIAYLDGKPRSSLSEISPIKMLLSWGELREGMGASSVCPSFLLQWFSHESAA